eukprot:13986271-Alexandrium_andersonii.AAC.1
MAAPHYLQQRVGEFGLLSLRTPLALSVWLAMAVLAWALLVPVAPGLVLHARRPLSRLWDGGARVGYGAGVAWRCPS